jgi:uncharacterized protein
MMIKTFLAFIFSIMATFALAGDPMTFAVDPEMLMVSTEKGGVVYEVEIADTDTERSAGLMFRIDFPKHRAMLFDFGQTRSVSMWMKNTPLPLDMLFIDETGLVVGVAANTTPQSLDVLSAPQPIRYVLEINAGQANLNDIKPGAQLMHPLIKQ